MPQPGSSAQSTCSYRRSWAAGGVTGGHLGFVAQPQNAIEQSTPAPIAPTHHLVVTGLYRYVRNPIYIALVSVTVGQALLFGDGRLLWYGAVVWLAFHLFVVLYEEPTLQLKFGIEYETFRANVPRWIPRLTPWRTA